MTQMSVAPQSMPVAAPPQTAAAAGAAADPAPGAEADIEFAVVLKAQIAQPAKDVPAADIFAALLPSPTADAAAEAAPADGLPAAPDLSAFLPTLPALPTLPTLPTLPAQPALASPTPSVAMEIPPAAAETALAAGIGAANPAAPAQTAASEPAGEEAAPAATQPLRQAAGLSARPEQTEAVTIAARTPLAVDPQMPAAAAEHANPHASTHAAAPLAHAAPAGDALSSVRVGTPVGSRGWDAEVGQKIVLLANRQESRAELTLTPPQLGKVEITISVNGDQTSAAFVSASPAAREALEQALPRLREILAEAGITLGQASVNAESARRDGDELPRDGRGTARGTDAARGVDAPAQWLRQSNGLIDTFA